MDGLIFMVIGMTAVFLFLTIMVFLMNGMKFFMKFLPAETEDLSGTGKKNQDLRLEEIAIAVAIAKKSMEK